MNLKKDLAALVAVLFVTCSYLGAAQITRWQVNRSSNSSSNDTTVLLPKSDPGDILGSVIVNKCGTGQSNLTIYDSSGTTDKSFGVIDTSSSSITGSCLRQIDYFIPVSSAITYTKTGGADVTILWNNNRED